MLYLYDIFIFQQDSREIIQIVGYFKNPRKPVRAILGGNRFQCPLYQIRSPAFGTAPDAHSGIMYFIYIFLTEKNKKLSQWGEGVYKTLNFPSQLTMGILTVVIYQAVTLGGDRMM